MSEESRDLNSRHVVVDPVTDRIGTVPCTGTDCRFCNEGDRFVLKPIAVLRHNAKDLN